MTDTRGYVPAPADIPERAETVSWPEIMSSIPLFSVTDSFVVRGRGTVLIGPPESEARKVLSVGDSLEIRFPDGTSIKTRISGLESFIISPPRDDPPIGVLLAEDIGRVPVGTTVHSLA